MHFRAQEVEIAANNIANVSTDGFKRDRLIPSSFGDLLISRMEAFDNTSTDAAFRPPIIGMMNLGGPAGETDFIDFSQGAPRETGNPLDLYIGGPGFFVMNTPNGERYTRNGNFMLNSSGEIVNSSGHTLQGDNGQSIRITSPAPIDIRSNGEITQDGLPVGKIRIVEFSDPQAIEKEGNTYFRLIDPNYGLPTNAVTSTIEQGTIEGSNVDAIDSLVNLITAQRAYEAAARAVDMFNQSLSMVSGDMGRLPA
ncbi:MAG: flagellar hook-basal body protein, partial [bacterium]|nr:flagellar hook-basal body protein [bacterium]